MTADRRQADAVVEVARALHARGWVANHDGNVTVRLGADRYLATPTATSKAKVTRDSLLVVDGEGKRVSGRTRPFSEINLHLAIYAARTDVGAVVHAHPPHATALACSGSDLLARPFIAEAVVSLGPAIPTVPFAPPGPAAARAVAAVARDVDAALLGNHGVLTWAADVELAYLRMELVEHLARIAIAAQAVGGVRPLPADAIGPLLAARARAGLGAAADRAAAAQSPAPVASASTDALAAIVREEVLRALGRH
ncbi:MAG: class II aldolase/adducin family protein [Deltaproteobacteria bacterium]|nr:MAG: class II aldolase/adducin family protein [Deltaproteobacteria bacterium]